MKDLLNLVSYLSSNSLRVDIKLLSDGIYVPKLTEEFDTFSVQGNLVLTSNSSKAIKKITLKFKGCVDRLRSSENGPQKSIIIENEMELLELPMNISKGDTTLSFELALPRTLPPSINSEYFKVNYTMIALVELEDSKTPFNFPMKVYNHYLIPHLDLRFNSYSDSGKIEEVMDYGIDFPKRFFSKDELIPLKVSIQPEDSVQLNYITAKLIQKVALMDDSTQTPIDETPYTISLSKETQYFTSKQFIYEKEFYLPILNKSDKFILPTMDSNHFEVIHQIQLTVNYQVKSKPLIQYLNIKVPIAITTQYKNSLVELPDYLSIEEEKGILLNVGELPPIYSI